MNPYVEAIKRGALKGVKQTPREFFLPLINVGYLLFLGLACLYRTPGRNGKGSRTTPWQAGSQSKGSTSSSS